MLKNTYRLCLYVLIALMIAGGGVLFLAREAIINYLRAQNNIIPPTTYVKTASSTSGETLDIDLLKTAKFKALKNNVLQFDFDKICQRPAATLTTLAETATTTIENATTTPPTNCAVGNSNLFFIKNN
ncbi:MAG: hypothetical protein WC523_03530 [Patescibacteria group bacterium]